MFKKARAILVYATPVAMMIALIPFVSNDYVLTFVYVLFVVALLSTKKERHDLLALVVGFIAMTVSEYVFVKTGVETFLRNTFLGVMPLWLPVLWAYAFVSIKRVLRALDR